MVLRLRILAICFVTTYYSFASITDSINYSENPNILQSYYKFQIQNDYNLFTGLSDDRGYSVGGGHYVRLMNYEKFRYFDIILNSRLYTDFIPNSVHYVNSDKVYNQNFNEINTLSFSVGKFLEKHKLFTHLGGGIGIINKDKPIPGFALYGQGGSDGFGGFHRWMFDDIHYKSISREKIKYFVFAEPALTKHFLFDYKYWKYNKPFIELNAGLKLGTPQIQSSAYFNIYSEIPFLQKNGSKFKTASLTGILASRFMFHSTGLLFNPEAGIKLSIYNMEFSYSVYKQIGKQQTEVIEFYDSESIMTLFIRVNFNNKLK